MITLFQIDKSGSDVFEKDYSIALIKNNETVYGINIPQIIKDKIIHLFHEKKLGIESKSPRRNKLRFKIRFHTAIIILLLEKAIKDEGYAEDVNIQLCNDIDGHIHEMRDMIFKNLSKMIPSLNKEHIVQTKFPKTSLVDIAAKNLREKNKEEVVNYIVPKIKTEDLIKIIKK